MHKKTETSLASFVTLRSIFIAALLIVINSHWQTLMSSELDIELTDLALFCNVIAILFVLVLLNHSLRHLAPAHSLQQRELLTIYTMLATSTALNGTDMVKCLVSLVGNGTWYATPENDWDQLFGRYLPPWLTISDRQALRGYYEGQSTLYNPTCFRLWMPRAVAWTGFTVVLIFVMLCLNVIVRKQWVRNERLTYPIAQLPFEMTQIAPESELFRNRLMWIGFLAAALVSGVNQAHVWYPSVPALPVQPLNLGRYFDAKPWNAVQYMYRTFYPFAIGLGYLMPLDLIVSTWFFHLFWQVERIVGSAAGFAALPRFPYAEAQLRGGWVALLVFAIWMGRRYFLNVLVEIFRGSPKAHSDEPMTYRNAALGMIGGSALLVIFCRSAGMSLWAMIPFFVVYFALATTITRIRAELGPPVHTLVGATPDTFLISVFGTRQLGPQNLVGFGMLHWILGSAGRENPMPIQLEAFKFAERLRMKSTGLIFAILFAAGLGVISGFWAYLHDAYKVGVESYPEQTWAASVGFRLLESRLQSPETRAPGEAIFAVAGFCFTLGMGAIRTRFLGWPFHPVGYVISGGWDVGRIWIPLVLASTTKWGVLRFYGIKGYRQSIPFFFGLILGDFVIGSLWATIGVIFKTPVYVYWTG
jgi:hypothetical protein